MYDLTDFCLDVVGSTCVTATKYGAKWISDPSKYPILFNNKAVDKAIGTWLEIKVPLFKYLLDNCLKKNWKKNISDYRNYYRIRPYNIHD